MKETGLLMRPELALATREGRKTMTRRIVKPQPWKENEYKGSPEGIEKAFYREDQKEWWFVPKDVKEYDPSPYSLMVAKCPYGVPGDQIYVKEPFRVQYPGRDIRPDETTEGYWLVVEFKDGLVKKLQVPYEDWERWRNWKDRHAWKSPFFMFKSLARTWMEITAVRAERIQDITNDDAMREGVPAMMKTDPITMDYSADHLGPFKYLWDSINKARGNGWDENKWQWVITYKLIEP